MPAENVMTPCKLFDEEHSVGNFMSVKPCTPKPKNKCTLLLIGPIKTDFTGSLDLSVWLNGLKETEQGGFNFFLFFFTVAMSMDAVASSMIRMLLLRTKALARQKSCRWPTLKFSPPSVTTASVQSLRLDCTVR